MLHSVLSGMSRNFINSSVHLSIYSQKLPSIFSFTRWCSSIQLTVDCEHSDCIFLSNASSSSAVPNWIYSCAEQMDSDPWEARLSTSSRRYRSRLGTGRVNTPFQVSILFHSQAATSMRFSSFGIGTHCCRGFHFRFRVCFPLKNCFRFFSSFPNWSSILLDLNWASEFSVNSPPFHALLRISEQWVQMVHECFQIHSFSSLSLGLYLVQCIPVA